MIRETGKRRKSRIELGYYQTPDRLSRWRTRLWAFAILAAAGWLVAASIAGRDAASHAWSLEPRQLASKGPVTQSHAMWDSKCEACHDPFAPINGSRWAPTSWTGAHSGSEKCTTCHAGPAHHKNERKGDTPACAECHRDHRGREASLLAMDDSTCTACHRDLVAHRDPAAGTLSVAGSVTRFDREHHPEIAVASSARSVDPRRIKFNHALHLAAGLTLEKGGSPFTLAQVPAGDRARYGWKDKQPLSGAVQLECAACHQTDGAERARAVDGRAVNAGAPRAPGAYMLPITYENDCAACHPRPFDAKLPGRQVRHGISPREVLDELNLLYRGEAVSADPELLRQFVPPREIPGPPSPKKNQLIQDAVDHKVLAAAKRLFGADPSAESKGCVECHNLKPTAEPLVDSSSLSKLEIEPVLMTPVWFKSAVFNHRTHRALGCAECHSGATESRKTGDRVLIPAMSQCVTCHAPAGGRLAGQPGGASTACTECHRYHNGDHPEQGLGARARRGEIEQTLERFLSGGREAK